MIQRKYTNYGSYPIYLSGGNCGCSNCLSGGITPIEEYGRYNPKIVNIHRPVEESLKNPRQGGFEEKTHLKPLKHIKQHPSTWLDTASYITKHIPYFTEYLPYGNYIKPLSRVASIGFDYLKGGKKPKRKPKRKPIKRY